jgi:hypothetical protein
VEVSLDGGRRERLINMWWSVFTIFEKYLQSSQWELLQNMPEICVSIQRMLEWVRVVEEKRAPYEGGNGQWRWNIKQTEARRRVRRKER